MSNTTAGASAAAVVLVVENDILERLATAAELRRLGFEVLEAANIAEAKTILRSVAVDVLFSNESLIDGRQLAQGSDGGACHASVLGCRRRSAVSAAAPL